MCFLGVRAESRRIPVVVGDCDGLQVELARLHRVVAELRVRGIHDQGVVALHV